MRGVSPRHRPWGWYQLDAGWANRLVADADLPAGALVLDVGAGTGNITAALVEHGAHVIAVELHHERADVLRRAFPEHVIVVRADAADLRLPRRPFHVVANPPYAMTSAILRRVLHRGSRLVTAHLVLQEQAARRWAGAGAPGANRWRQDFDAFLGPPVPRHSFVPRAPVDARVLVIRRRRRT